MVKDNQKVEDFDFADMTDALGKKEKDGLVRESAKKKIARFEKQTATSGSLNPKMIKEARELAESPKGLDIDKFMQKHKLINIDLEQLLQAPLKKDGSYA